MSHAHRYVYKIGESFATSGPLVVSPLDSKDGFIHMSTAEQAPSTAGRFFRESSSLELLKIPIDRIADRVRWEASSNHGIFPHLYGKLLQEDIIDRKRFTLSDQDEGWEAVLKADDTFLEN